MIARLLLLCSLPAQGPPVAVQPVEVGGVYPHLAVFGDEGECGIGALVPWAGRLWFLTYPPHRPLGSSDRLWSVGPDLDLESWPGSVGGTHAARMVHRESEQLLIGPYLVDRTGEVRVIPRERMPGRLTGIARHLGEPARKAYWATMEEGLYEVDLVTLEVTELFADDQQQIGGPAAAGDHRPLAALPGYHGKGLASGQGRVVYSNNGEPGPEALRRPDVVSGCLAEWDGERWSVVRRAQFTETTGPGTVWGSEPGAPLWSIGFDHRSLILMLLDGGRWSSFRLPRASHAYDGAHGWNTEWPRIRDVGEPDLVMTMHGAFWSFPREFARGRTAGLRQRSTYLRVVGDLARFGDRVVLGCDDVARSGFLNEHDPRVRVAGPGQSHSNLWFLEPRRLDELGPRLGSGSLWAEEDLAAGTVSEPFLVAGFEQRVLLLAHSAEEPRVFLLEGDRDGSGRFEDLVQVNVPPGRLLDVPLDPLGPLEWLRLTVREDTPGALATLRLRGADRRGVVPAAIFDGLARRGEPGRRRGGLVRSRGGDLRTLALVSRTQEGEERREEGLYELDGALELRRSEDGEALAWHRENLEPRPGWIERDVASLLHVDPDGRRWRLPVGHPGAPLLAERTLREVVTERNLLHAGGTFFELPAANAGGFAHLRPVATHPLAIEDMAAYRGLLVLTGVSGEGPRIVRSQDGRAALWVGVLDELWQLGKPRGAGGPWKRSRVVAEVPSDPYLVHGYDEKHLSLELHEASGPVRVRLELDATGDGHWYPWRTLELEPGERLEWTLDPHLAAAWLRAVSDRDGVLTLWLEYR